MANVDSGFDQLEDFVSAMLHALEGAERKKLYNHIAQTMRRSNQKRIAAQKNPDGTAFAKRKAPKDDQKSRTAKKLLYPAGGFGRPRMVVMKSWKKMGEDRFIGYDRRAGGMRTFLKSKVIRYLPDKAPDGGGSDGKMQRRRTIRAAAMFRKIKMARYLRTGQSPDDAWIGFVGMLGHIASVHQYGEKDKPHPFSEEIDYAQRELLGLTAQDRDELLDVVIARLVV